MPHAAGTSRPGQPDLKSEASVTTPDCRLKALAPSRLSHALRYKTRRTASRISRAESTGRRGTLTVGLRSSAGRNVPVTPYPAIRKRQSVPTGRCHRLPCTGRHPPMQPGCLAGSRFALGSSSVMRTLGSTCRALSGRGVVGPRSAFRISHLCPRPRRRPPSATRLATDHAPWTHHTVPNGHTHRLLYLVLRAPAQHRSIGPSENHAHASGSRFRHVQVTGRSRATPEPGKRHPGSRNTWRWSTVPLSAARTAPHALSTHDTRPVRKFDAVSTPNPSPARQMLLPSPALPSDAPGR